MAPPRLDRQAGHQRDRAGDIQPLLARLLRVAEHHVFDLGRIDAGPLDERLDAGDGQIVAPHVAEPAPLLVRPADGRADAVDDDGSLSGVRAASVMCAAPPCG